jgi:cbb3-type cytochrome oxidase subunit 3
MSKFFFKILLFLFLLFIYLLTYFLFWEAERDIGSE